MAYDFYAEINQSTLDKLVSSVSYPFVIIERREDFPGCTRVNFRDEGDAYSYSKEEANELFRRAVQFVIDEPDRSQQSIHDQIYSFGASLIQQAKVIQQAQDQDGYEGPGAREINAILDGGIADLGETLTLLGDWGIYAWNPYLRVTLLHRPSIRLGSPRINLNGILTEVRATGEAWIKYPWFNCYKWCTQWKKVIKCERIASITVSPEIAAEAHADIVSRGVRVFAAGAFDRLRLNYPILDKIPLEGIANRLLGQKELLVYDASELLATVPLLRSRFVVNSIALPNKSDGIGIGVDVRQI